MTSQTRPTPVHDVKFEYQDKHGNRLSTNRPEIVQWGICARFALQGLAFVIFAIGASSALNAHGGNAAGIIKSVLGKVL